MIWFWVCHQTWDAMELTIRKTLELKPDRLHFLFLYSRSVDKGVGQRGFDENDLPSGEEKRKLYENGKNCWRIRLYRSRNGSFFTRKKDDLYQSLIHKNSTEISWDILQAILKLMVGLGIICDFGFLVYFCSKRKNRLKNIKKRVERELFLWWKDIF